MTRTEAKQLHEVINNIVAAYLKSDEAPMSAETHLDKAIATLVAMRPDWHPWCPDAQNVVNDAKAHMAFYQKHSTK